MSDLRGIIAEAVSSVGGELIPGTTRCGQIVNVGEAYKTDHPELSDEDYTAWQSERYDRGGFTNYRVVFENAVKTDDGTVVKEAEIPLTLLGQAQINVGKKVLCNFVRETAGYVAISLTPFRS